MLLVLLVSATILIYIPIKSLAQTNLQSSNKESYQYLGIWGTNGTSKGQFVRADYMAIDQLDNVYVTLEDKIQKFDKDGNFITKWGSEGEGDGQFIGPGDKAIDSKNHVYVLDYGNNRVQKFDSDGNFITKWGSEGTSDGQFQRPTRITADSLDDVYVVDSDNNRIQKFDSDGNFITKWGFTYTDNYENNLYVYEIAIDSLDNVYVMDISNYNIQKFDKDGNFITKWGTNTGSAGEIRDIAVDSKDKVYVTSSQGSSHRIEVYSLVPDDSLTFGKDSGENNTTTISGNKNPSDGKQSVPQLPTGITDQV